MRNLRARFARHAAVVGAVVLSATLIGIRPAGAIAGDTITDPQDTPNGLDIQQATRSTDQAAGTETITIQDYQPFTDQQATFLIVIKTTSGGYADKWAVATYDSTSNKLFGGVGPAGSFHLTPVTVTRPATNSIAVTFPLAAINNSTTFDWAVESHAPPATAGGTTIVDDAPDQPTARLGLPVRIAGSDRIDTAIQSSFFLNSGAESAVLARADAYPDALGGAPLAAAKNGPLLLTSPTSLDPRVLAEIQRVLPSGKTVYLLGGLSALSQSVEDAIKAAGYTTVRYAGTDRFDTSLQVVHQGLGDPATIFLTTGANFPDALSAGAAAAKMNAGILLSNDTQLTPSVAAYLQAHSTDTVDAVGGPAAAADPSATPIVGADRYDTSARVAQTFFSSPAIFGVASGANYPDALAGGATMGEVLAPLLLTDPNTLSAPTQNYLAANKANLRSNASYLFGGTAAVSDSVRVAISQTVYT